MGLPLSGFRLKNAIQSWCFDTAYGKWEVPSYSRIYTHVATDLLREVIGPLDVLPPA
jgi:hypothetical protein